MAHRRNRKTGSSFLVVALAAILVSGGILAACSRAQSTTSAPAATTTSTSTRITTSATTSTSAPAPTSTSAPTSTGVSAADFYKNNVVTIIVPYGPGGSVDYGARLFSNFWTEVTGGRMVVDNKAGAGGLLGANAAYAAKPDGLTICACLPGTGLITPVLAQDPAVKFDMSKLNWLEDIPDADSFGYSISPKLPDTSMGSLSKVKGLKFASSSRTSSTSLGAGVVIDFFGLQDARIVLGYAGTSEALLSVAKGETDGYVTGNAQLLDGLNKALNKKPLVSLSLQRDNYFTDVPAVSELLKLSPEQEGLIGTMTALRTGNGYWFGPGVPPDRIEFVRNAFDKIANREDFQKQAKVAWAVMVKPVGGKDFGALMDKTLAVATKERYSELQKLADKYIR